MKVFCKGQMTLIMLFIVAVTFILYAASMNWGKITAIKTQVTVAANTAAAGYASMLGSYAQSLKASQLQGNFEHCDTTSALESLLTMILMAIIIIVVVIVTGGTGVVAVGLLVSAGVGLAAATASYVIQQTMVQPGITSSWRKWQQNLDIQDQFLEQGIQGMLTGATSDMVMIPDRWDMDMDGNWWDKTTLSGNSHDTVSRFSYYYTMRQNVPVAPPPNDIPSLKELLRLIQIDLGMYSFTPVSCYMDVNNALLKPECNQCCQPVSSRPPYCSQDPVPIECQSAFGCVTATPQTCYVYNPSYQNQGDLPKDKIYRTIGHDDQIPSYATGSTAPQHGTGDHGQDPPTIDYLPRYAGTSSNIEGMLFQLLWMLKDTSPTVWNLTSDPINSASPACHWLANGVTCDTDTSLYDPAIANKLELDDPCQDDGCLVNKFADSMIYLDNSHLHSQQIDKVGRIAGFTPIADSGCSSSPGSESYHCGSHDSHSYIPPPYAPWWKPGADRRADTRNDAPIKHTNADMSGIDTNCDGDEGDVCSCSVVPHPEYWRDDSLDFLVDQMEAFLKLSGLIINTKTAQEEKVFADTVQMWGPPLGAALLSLYHPFSTYSDASVWDPLTDHWQTDCTARRESITLHSMLGARLFPALYGWLNANYVNSQAWCVTSSGLTEIKDDAEKTYIQGGATSLERVIRCLEYEGGQVAGVGSNYDRFAQCDTNIAGFSDATLTPAIAAAQCGVLPRSLVGPLSTFDPNYSLSHPSATAFPVNYNYKGNIHTSMELARNQSLKFAKRFQYLRELKTRVDQLKDTFYNTYLALESTPCYSAPDGLPAGGSWCVPGGACCDPMYQGYPRIINAMHYIDHMMKSGSEGKIKLGNEVIYGWFSEPSKSGSQHTFTDGTTGGSLHLVKVQGSIPGRRKIAGLPPMVDGRCPGDFDGEDTGAPYGSDEDFNECIPWIDTRLVTGEWWEAQERCYTLTSWQGNVGARVIRYDEDQNQNNMMKFLSGLPLWQIFYNNPHATPPTEQEIQDLYNTCFADQHAIRMCEQPDCSTGKYKYEWDSTANTDPDLKQAFLISRPYGKLNPTDPDEFVNTGGPPYSTLFGSGGCWEKAEQFMGRGLVSESCAYYDAQNNEIKFKPCS